MKIKYFMFVLFVWCLLVNGSSYCVAEEKKRGICSTWGDDRNNGCPLECNYWKKSQYRSGYRQRAGNKGDDNIDGNLPYNKTTNRP